MTSLYMGFQIYSLTKRLVALSTFVGLHCDCPLARRKKYEPPLKQILVTATPKFGESEGELGMPDSNENEILFPSETNPNCSCPKFGEVRGALRGPEAVFRHFVMKKVNRSDSISTFMYVGGLINRFQPVSCPRSDSTRPLLFSHPLSGGHRTRLRIRSETNPNDNLMMRRAGLSS